MAARIVAVVGLAIGVVVHVMFAFSYSPVMGVLFGLSALGMLVGAVLLFTSPRLGWIVGGGVAGLTALGYIARSTVGLPPLIPNPVPFSRPFSGVVCTIAEIVVVALAVWALSRGRARSGVAAHSAA